MSSILSAIPKQRQTGLFSATQAKAVEQLLKFGLRNPVRITVSREGEVNVGTSVQAVNTEATVDVAPRELENFHLVSLRQQRRLCSAGISVC